MKSTRKTLRLPIIGWRDWIAQAFDYHLGRLPARASGINDGWSAPSDDGLRERLVEDVASSVLLAGPPAHDSE